MPKPSYALTHCEGTGTIMMVVCSQRGRRHGGNRANGAGWKSRHRTQSAHTRAPQRGQGQLQAGRRTERTLEGWRGGG